MAWKSPFCLQDKVHDSQPRVVIGIYVILWTVNFVFVFLVILLFVQKIYFSMQ
jgi:hypothetical protein